MTSTTRKRRLFRPRIHWTVKQEIWAMSCAVCGYDSKHTQIDHIIPIKLGGSSERENLQPLCRWCNGLKGPRLMTNAEIAEKIKGQR